MSRSRNWSFLKYKSIFLFLLSCFLFRSISPCTIMLDVEWKEFRFYMKIQKKRQNHYFFFSFNSLQKSTTTEGSKFCSLPFNSPSKASPWTEYCLYTERENLFLSKIKMASWTEVSVIDFQLSACCLKGLCFWCFFVDWMTDSCVCLYSSLFPREPTWIDMRKGARSSFTHALTYQKRETLWASHKL